MRKVLTKSRLLPLALAFLIPTFAMADDKAESPVEVHEWSVWVANPAQPTWNASRVYRNAMPSSVGTSRPKFEGKDLDGKFPVAPLSMIRFFGEPKKDVDVEIKIKQGTYLAHWPPGAERGGRIQWFGSDFLATPPADIPPPYLPENSWFAKLRDDNTALILKRESVYERFLAYDTEFLQPVPVKIRGGPDEYTLQNLTGRKLVDVAVVAPGDDGGFRVGWLDELPAAVAEKKTEEVDPKKPKPSNEEKVEGVFKEPEPKKEDDAPPPLPAEGDANVKAQVDQQLNRPVTVNVDQAPRKEILDFVTGQVRIGYDLDTKTLAKADINMSQPSSLKADGTAARDAIAEVLGGVGLSYRVTDNGRLFITTAARLADEGNKKGKVIEGPPVKLAMSPNSKPGTPSFKELTVDAMAARLKRQGLRDEAAQTLLRQYGPVLFEPGELVILAHLSREGVDDLTTVEIFPPPRKLVRTGLVVIHGVDPRLQDRAKAFVKQLGDDTYKTREAAEARLLELGPVAVPSLEDALKEKDIEIVFRAERLLLKLGRQVP